ncbi:MAG: phosphocholine cytidylyltransferase family protein [Candidatus Celaenobacter antarcticus]|nr:phosphocholine cytidylyltransferase family protein [Candidatus Celaenobacter antarcticus]
MTSIKTAIILAAGRGSRLKEQTLEKPKPMTHVNNITIIDNLIYELNNQKIKNIVVVTGYMSQKLEKHLQAYHNDTNIIFVENEIYDSTNNIYSLWLAKDYMENGFFLFEADIFCDESLICELVHYPHHNLIVVDQFKKGMDGTVVELTSDGLVKEMYLKRHQGEGFSFYKKYKTVNFYKFSGHYSHKYLIPKMENHIKRDDVNVYYEQIIKEDIDEGHSFYALETGDNRWWEIDTPEDLEKARSMFNEK